MQLMAAEVLAGSPIPLGLGALFRRAEVRVLADQAVRGWDSPANKSQLGAPV